MAVRMWDLGNVLARVEQIKNARYQRDPSNPQNQLNMLRIQQAQAELDNPQGAGVGINPINPRDYTGPSIAKFRQTGDFNDLERYESPKTLIRIDKGPTWEIRNSITGEIVDVIDKGLGPTQTPEYVGGMEFLKGANRLAAEGGTPPVFDLSMYANPQGAAAPATQAQPTTPAQPVAQGQPAQTAVPKTKAQLAAEQATAVDTAKANVARNDPEILYAKQQRYTEANDALSLIDSLLGDGKTNVPALSAFGKIDANPYVPDVFRSQETLDARAQLDQVRGLLSLESRQKLKGQGTITDSEQETLAQSATVLANPYISDDLVIKELKRVKNIFGMAAKRAQLSPSQLKVLGDYTPPDQTAAQPTVELPTVTTQEEYDSLPSGAEFIEDGVKYRKP